MSDGNVSSKLVETCESKTDTMDHFLQGIDQSQWLKHIKAVLETSVFMAESITSGVSGEMYFLMRNIELRKQIKNLQAIKSLCLSIVIKEGNALHPPWIGIEGSKSQSFETMGHFGLLMLYRREQQVDTVLCTLPDTSGPP